MKTREALIAHLKGLGVLNSLRLEEAFRRIDRARFVPPGTRSFAYEDCALPLWKGQTISQPYTVAFMLDLLDVKQGMQVLDIGAGSGWTTALLCVLTGQEGQVTGLERLPELTSFGQANLASCSFGNGSIRQAGTALGCPGKQYDRILVSASPRTFPRELTEQLNPGGIIVMPVGREIRKIVKTPEGSSDKLSVERHTGFVFVPLVYGNQSSGRSMG